MTPVPPPASPSPTSDSVANRGRLDGMLDRLRTLQPVANNAAPLNLVRQLRTPLGKRYKILRELGRGGMAIVFLAEDLKHRRKVALKVIRPELIGDITNTRFLNEIAIVAQLVHPHILPLHDSGEAGGLLFFVMPYVEGESLRDRLVREERLPVADALRIAREIAGALSYAHGRDVIHRDIKPENILLQAGQAVVSDFGIARAMTAAGGEDLTELAIALGTPAYMSPEQVRGDAQVDGRADVYSLGCVLYEMLSGEPPFRGDTTEQVLDRHLTDPPPRPETPGVPEIVKETVRRALAKAPSDRYPSAAEFDRALAHAAEIPVIRSRRARLALAVGGTTALALLAVGATTLAARRGPMHPAASVLAVIPLQAAPGDSTLAGLGRDLVVTLSANLDGVSEIRTIDALTILAQTRDVGAVSLADAFRLAGRLGATSVVHGTVTRTPPNIRVDVGLFALDSRTRIARVSREMDARDLGAVTDTMTWTLLREIWRTRAPPTPNLAAVTTRSLPALREFLDGERASLESRWDAAAESYARAMQADSTFWLAHWRYSFARWWYLEAVDDKIIRAIRANSRALPERDRLVFESWVTDSIPVALARSQEVVTRYPDYWPGWMQHGDWLFHVGPVYGRDMAEARQALARAVELNPSLLPAWEHLYWASIHDDTATAFRALEALDRLRFDRTSKAEFGFDIGRVYRYEREMLRGNPAQRLRDSIVVDLVTTARGRLGSGATLAPAQIAISERVLRARPRPDVAALHERLLAEAWAARGAWDSAMVVIDRYALRPNADPVHAFRLAVIGHWVGALSADAPARRRSAAALKVSRPGTNAMGRAELAWLDGLRAATARDASALADARERVRRVDTVSTALLDATLGAFEAELHGDRAIAAATLAATNWQNPDLLVPGYGAHPYVIAVSRMTAARWKAAEGDTAEARRLFKWFEAQWALDGYRPARRVLAPIAARELP